MKTFGRCNFNLPAVNIQYMRNNRSKVSSWWHNLESFPSISLQCSRTIPKLWHKKCLYLLNNAKSVFLKQKWSTGTSELQEGKSSTEKTYKNIEWLWNASSTWIKWSLTLGHYKENKHWKTPQSQSKKKKIQIWKNIKGPSGWDFHFFWLHHLMHFATLLLWIKYKNIKRLLVVVNDRYLK